MSLEDVLTAPKMLNFGFQCIDPCRQSGNLYVGKERLKLLPNTRFQHLSHFDIFFQLYFMKYIKDVIIPDTNKHLMSPMVIGEYFRVIGC